MHTYRNEHDRHNLYHQETYRIAIHAIALQCVLKTSLNVFKKYFGSLRAYIFYHPPPPSFTRELFHIRAWQILNSTFVLMYYH